MAMSKTLNKLLDTASLKTRLTFGIATVAALGLGSLAAWTSMQMEHILLSKHKENMEYMAARFPMDIEIYSKMIPLEAGAQRAISSFSTEDKLIWLKNPQGEVTAKSDSLDTAKFGNILLTVQNVPLTPTIYDLKGSYWLMCSTPLQIGKANLGKLYLGYNITNDRMIFWNLICNLAWATAMTIAIMTIAIAIYIDRSMQPLKKISQLASTISAESLNQARLNLERAPSEVRELAETVDQMLLRLAESWSHQQELLSNVSHELRTPLTIISGYIQSILRRGDNLSEMQTEALNTAASEADRTVQLLQDLLDLARADGGRIQFQLENIVLNDLVQEVVGMAEQFSERAITVDSSPEPILVKADRDRFKQVLLNLIDNAVKYSDTGTPITLKLLQTNEQAVIQIRDRGVGISLQQQGRIFERFFRVDESRNRSGGTGLGLSIVKTLIEGMGGHISVRSHLNEGSTFTINFPL